MAALAELRLLPRTTDVRMSAPIETVAVTLDGEDADAPRYLNAVALLQTRLAPATLLRELHRIEADHGRVRRERSGATGPSTSISSPTATPSSTSPT